MPGSQKRHAALQYERGAETNREQACFGRMPRESIDAAHDQPLTSDDARFGNEVPPELADRRHAKPNPDRHEQSASDSPSAGRGGGARGLDDPRRKERKEPETRRNGQRSIQSGRRALAHRIEGSPSRDHLGDHERHGGPRKQEYARRRSPPSARTMQSRARRLPSGARLQSRRAALSSSRRPEHALLELHMTEQALDVLADDIERNERYPIQRKEPPHPHMLKRPLLRASGRPKLPVVTQLVTPFVPKMISEITRASREREAPQLPSRVYERAFQKCPYLSREKPLASALRLHPGEVDLVGAAARGTRSSRPS